MLEESVDHETKPPKSLKLNIDEDKSSENAAPEIVVTANTTQIV